MEFDAKKAPKEVGNLKERTHNYSKGYAFIPGRLLFDNRISDGAKITWIVIYKLPGSKKGEYIKRNKSLESIADLRGLKKRQIQRHMAELKKYEYVFTRQRYNKSSIIILHVKKDE